MTDEFFCMMGVDEAFVDFWDFDQSGTAGTVVPPSQDSTAPIQNEERGSFLHKLLLQE